MFKQPHTDLEIGETFFYKKSFHITLNVIKFRNNVEIF